MKIITTHLHADFDCLASMVAARKLYPDAVLVFPGSQEKNVRDYLAQTDFHIPYRKLKGFNLDQVKQMIIVDASTRERVGVFAELAGKEGMINHLYDHHPFANVDIPHQVAVIRERGATVTIFCEIFRERGITLTPAEATLMAMGLYEDTGSLTFSSVRTEDYEAARWLHGQGADLNAVAINIAAELNAPQIDMLNTLIKNMEYEPVGGVTVAITSASTPRYIGDLSVLAHKIMDMENYNALFTLVRMADRIHFIARSRVEGVNAGAIAEKLGGGGHPTAASATIKDLTLPQVIEKLKSALVTELETSATAAEMMVEKVITVESEDMINEAEAVMTKFDIGGAPVMDNGKVAGLITRQIVEKAIFHKMESRPVSDFMISEFETVEPGSPVKEVERIVLGRRQKLTPVVDRAEGKLVGVISRGMVLNKLYGESLLTPSGKDRFSRTPRRDPLRKNVSGLMKELLPERIIELLGLIARVADGEKYTAYVVGGFVRDLLLRTPNIDVDIVIEGDGIGFARKLAAELDGRVHPHEKFKTAVVTLPDGFKLDVATARIEYYAHPAALPVVEMSAIRNDLYRRDFSINAMAIRLSGNRPNTLIDFFGGQADLKDHAVRVLHNLSFVEDPTRAFRAVRFESRYGFILGKQTLALLKGAVRQKLFNRLSGDRLFTELVMILKERHPAGAIARMKELGLLKFIHPSVTFDSTVEKTLDRLEELVAWYDLTFPGHPAARWQVFMMALLGGLDEKELGGLCEKFDSARQVLIPVVKSLNQAGRTAGEFGRPSQLTNSSLHQALGPLSDEALLYMAAKSPSGQARSAVTRYLTEIKGRKPFVTGEDLLNMGLSPSPEIGRTLEKVMAMQLDGDLNTREEALDCARELIDKAGREN